MDYNKLINAAIEARKLAYVPYSNFAVGAAILTKSGNVITGCNIENAAFSPTNCAERTAVFKAVSEGITDFTAIVVVGGSKDGELQYCFPCGVCRQVLKEFAPLTLNIIVAKSAEEYQIYTLEDLLPHGFGPEDIS